MAANQRRAGAILSYASLGINTLAAFVYVPILLRFLSVSEYGVYELIGSLIAYLSVMDLGLSTTLCRFYVQERVKHGEKAVENVLAMTAIIYLLLTVCAVGVGFICDFSLDALLSASFSESERLLAHQMMGLVIVNCAIVLPGNWFLAIINANERFVFARVLSIIQRVLQIVTAIAVLSVWSSALLLLVVQVVVGALGVIASAWYAFRRIGVRVRLHHWDWKLFWSMLGFSGFILLNMVFDQVFWKTGQVVLATTCGSAAVAVYGIACRIIVSGYMQVSIAITSVFLPKLTAISSQTADMSEINELFMRIGRLQAMLVWGVLAAFIVCGMDFVVLWAGDAYVDAYLPTVVLMVGLSISLIQNLGLSVLQAKNKMGFRAAVYTAIAVIDVVASIPASSTFGVLGCACVAAILLLIGTGPIINWYYWKKIGIDIPRFFRSVAPLLLPALIAAAITWGVSLALPAGYSWIAFIVKCLAFVVVYVGALLAHWFNGYERELLKSLLHVGRRKAVNGDGSE